MSPLNTDNKHHHAALNLPFYFIWSFVKFFWKTNCALLNTLVLTRDTYYLKQRVCHFLFPDCYSSFISDIHFLTCFHVFELLLELLWSKAVLVKSIVPFDLLQHLQVTTYKPITSLHDHLHKAIEKSIGYSLLTQIWRRRMQSSGTRAWWMPYYLNVRVLWTSGSPLSGTAFLFAVFIELRVPENSHAWTLVL